MRASLALTAALLTAAFSPSAMAAAVTERVSITSAETQIPAGSFRYGYGAEISSNGRFVVFESKSELLAPRDGAGLDLFVRDRRRGTTRTVSERIKPGGRYSGAYNPSITADGRHVAFTSVSDNLVPGDTNKSTDLFIRDMRRGTTSRVAPRGRRQMSPGGAVGSPSLSADGRYLAFSSPSEEWARGGAKGKWDVFLHDRRTGTTRLVSRAADGGPANGYSDPVMLAADGRHVAFWSRATNLVRGDRNRRPDLFVHDRVTGDTVRATVSSTGQEAAFPRPGYVATFGSISADGRRVAFMSRAENLVPGDTNRQSDVFVHDLRTRQTMRVSVTSAGEQVCEEPQFPRYVACSALGHISADGERVAFVSDAPELVPGDGNRATDVFVHDLSTRQTMRVSVDSAGGEVCERRRLHRDDCNSQPAISGDGRYVAFLSRAADIVPGDSNGRTDVFVRGPL
jgi:Tol biopolymer transport system component